MAIFIRFKLETVANIEQDFMKKKKKKITGKRGRPPKYITDDKGREIVGVSYHEKIKQFYITQSQPRIYLGTDQDSAIDRFEHSYPNYYDAIQEEAKYKDEIFHKALELLPYDENIRNHIRQIASDLLDQHMLHDQYLSMGLRDRINMEIKRRVVNESDRRVFIHDLAESIYDMILPDMVTKKVHGRDEKDKVLTLIREMLFATAHKCIIEEGCLIPKPESPFSREIEQVINEKIKDEAKKYYQKEGQESLIWDRAYDLITGNPIKAAKMLGIKELVYVAFNKINEEYGVLKPTKLPMPWWFVWWVYWDYADWNTPTYEFEVWVCTGVGLGLDADIDSISADSIIKAIRFDTSSVLSLLYEAQTYFAHTISITTFEMQGRCVPKSFQERLNIIRKILRMVDNIGFHQCHKLCESLMDDQLPISCRNSQERF
jgi:hypothetical protein